MIKQSENKLTMSTASPVKSIVAVLKATVEAHIFLIICFAVLALIYTYSNMPDAYLTPCVYTITAVSLILAGFEAARKAQVMGYLHGALAGFVCVLARILVSVAVFKSYVPSGSIGGALLLGIVISAAGGIAGVNSGKKRKRKK